MSDERVAGHTVSEACRRDELEGIGVRLLAAAGELKLALLNTFFATPERGVSCTFESPGAGKEIANDQTASSLTRQGERRLVRNVYTRPLPPPPPLGKPDSDHSLFCARVRFWCRIA